MFGIFLIKKKRPASSFMCECFLCVERIRGEIQQLPVRMFLAELICMNSYKEKQCSASKVAWSPDSCVFMCFTLSLCKSPFAPMVGGSCVPLASSSSIVDLLIVELSAGGSSVDDNRLERQRRDERHPREQQLALALSCDVVYITAASLQYG